MRGRAKRYMLDTGISSYVIRKRPDSVRARFGELDSGQLCVSVVSEAELLYGVKAKGSPRALAAMVADFLRRLHVLDWSRAAAVLVTNNEKHFRRVDGLKVENWA